MIKHLLLALTLAGIIYAMPFAIAQDNGANSQQSAPPAGGPPENGHRHFDPARRAQMLTKQLNLTSDQQAKVLDILKSEQSQMETLRSDSSVPQEDRRSKMMDIHKASDDQIRGLLDPDQQKKFDAMQSRRQQWQGQRQNGQAPPPSPDTSEQK